MLIVLYRIVCLFILLITVSCRNRQPDHQLNDEKPVAQVGERMLYHSEVAGMVPKGTSATDSTLLVSRYVDGWVRKQLLLERAAKEVKVDNEEMEQKVQEYRNALLMYEFEKQYVKQHLDSSVTDQEMQTYYQQNLANFTLKQNIVQGRMLALPKDAPKQDRAKALFRSNKEPDHKELTSYCYRFAQAYQLDDSLWVTLETLINNTPYRENANKAQFLQKNYFAQTTDGQNEYWVLIRDFKQANQAAPFSFVKGQIRDVILTKRRLALMQNLEKKTYEEARSANKFKMYTVK